MNTLESHTAPLHAPRETLVSSMVVSVILHLLVFGWVIGGAWLWGRRQPASGLPGGGGPPGPYTVSLVEGPPALGLPTLPGGGGSPGRPQGSPELEVSPPGPPAGSPAASQAPELAAPAPPAISLAPPPSAGSAAKSGAAVSKPPVEKLEPPAPKPRAEKPEPPAPKPPVAKPEPPTPRLRVEKPELPGPKPSVVKPEPPPPKPVAKLEPPPTPKPRVEKPAQPLPKPPEKQPEPPRTKGREPKPAAEKTPQPPKETITKESSEVSSAQRARQTIAQLRGQQASKEAAAQAEAAGQARQTIAQLREQQASEAAERQQATQRIADLRARVESQPGGTTGTGSSTGGSGGGSRVGSGGRSGGGSGSGGGGIASRMQDIRMRAYEARVREQITDAWNPPPTPGKSLEATALLTVDRDGQVTSFALLRRSGNAMFDESLLRAIRQASPLPPLPQDYSGQQHEFEATFRPYITRR